MRGHEKGVKVPKYIREKMHRVARLAELQDHEMKGIEEWLESKGFDVDALRDGGGRSLEELEYGNDITDSFCERLESNAEF